MKTRILLSLALIVALTGRAQETVPQSQSVLKSYFVTGAVPTQSDFDEWIDTMFWYINSTYTNSLAAAQSAQASQVANNRKFASLYLSMGMASASHQSWAFFSTNGFSSNSITTSTVNPAGTLEYTIWVTNYFTTPLSNVAYSATTPPAFFTCWEPTGSGGSFSGAYATWTPYSSPNNNGYVLTTNFFAIYAIVGANGGPTSTNFYWFTFYQ